MSVGIMPPFLSSPLRNKVSHLDLIAGCLQFHPCVLLDVILDRDTFADARELLPDLRSRSAFFACFSHKLHKLGGFPLDLVSATSSMYLPASVAGAVFSFSTHLLTVLARLARSSAWRPVAFSI